MQIDFAHARVSSASPNPGIVVIVIIASANYVHYTLCPFLAGLGLCFQILRSEQTKRRGQRGNWGARCFPKRDRPKKASQPEWASFPKTFGWDCQQKHRMELSSWEENPVGEIFSLRWAPNVHFCWHFSTCGERDEKIQTFRWPRITKCSARFSGASPAISAHRSTKWRSLE